MTSELFLIIGAVAGTVLGIAAVVMWWMNRTPRVDRDSTGVLPLFGGMGEADGASAAAAGVMAGGTVRQQPRPSTPRTSMASVVQVPTAWTPVTPLPSPPTPAAQAPGVPLPTPPRAVPQAETSPNVWTFTSGRPVVQPIEAPRNPLFEPEMPLPPANTPVVSHGVPGTMVEGHLLRFSVPQEGTLQFLPGRLEIAAGLDSGREIRFVHVPGPHGTEVTFGRSEGELYRHIQLRDQTVSRSHARMRLAEGRWYLLNLSQTNPIVHNGRVLSSGDEQPLADGDRIEMGEVLFTFRSR